MATSFKIIFDAYCNLTATHVEPQDNWICDQTLLRLLDAHYPNLKNSFGFTQALMVRALSAYAPPLYSTAKTNKQYLSKKNSTSCPYDCTKRRRVTYFYRQWNCKQPADPVSAGDIIDVHAGKIQIWGDNTRVLDTSALQEGGMGERVI